MQEYFQSSSDEIDYDQVLIELELLGDLNQFEAEKLSELFDFPPSAKRRKSLIDGFDDSTFSSTTIDQTSSLSRDSSNGSTTADSQPINDRPKNKYKLSTAAQARRRERRKVLKIPKVPHTDIRTQYLTILINIANLADFPKFYAFLHDFCRGDVQLIDNTPNNIEYNLPEYIELHGIPEVVLYWKETSSCIPDMTLQIEDYQIRSKFLASRQLTASSESGETASTIVFEDEPNEINLVAKYRMKGSKIFEPIIWSADYVQTAGSNLTLAWSTMHHSKDSFSQSPAESDVYTVTEDWPIDKHKLANPPIEILCDGFINLTVDDAGRIAKFHFY